MKLNVWVSGSGARMMNFTSNVLDVQTGNTTKVTAHFDGMITVSGESSSAKNLFVGIDKNQFNAFREGVIEDNPELLDNILMNEYKIKKFDEVNLIGHSNGGNVITRWTERYAKNRPFKVINLVTICTPFNGDTVSRNATGLLKEVLSDRNQLNGVNKKGFYANTGYEYYPYYGGSYYGDTVVTIDNAKTGEQVFGSNFTELKYQNGISGSRVNHNTAMNSIQVIDFLKTIVR